MNMAILILSALLAADPLGPGDYTRTLQHGGRTRSYLVHVPPHYDAKQPTPVVLAFHGGGANAEQMVRFCGLNKTADQEGFLAVYPNGSGQIERMLTWNAGNCCGYAVEKKVDDVGFVGALLDDLRGVARVDAKRVYATGMSNGSIMAYRLASEMSDRIAAIAPVSGPMGTAACNPKRPVSVMHFHGSDDRFAPFQGGKGTKSVSQTDFYSVDYSIHAWVKANDCPEKPKTEKLPSKAGDDTTVEKKTYGPGKEESEVILVTINGGGHTWPGRQPLLAGYFGKSSKSISANELMWEFFKRHPMK